MNSIAVVAAHPDDEILGCGGTIAAHVHRGDTVSVLILAQGIASRDGDQVSEQQEELYQAARRANDVVGTGRLEFGAFPDNRMDSVDLLDVVRRVEAFFAEVKPDCVYTHYPNDLNVDHRIVSQAVLTAGRPLPGVQTTTILFFETPSSTEWSCIPMGGGFSPNWFTDISETLDVKLQALQAYAMEMRPFPHARSLEAVRHLAHWRGASAGLAAAEAFMLARHLCK